MNDRDELSAPETIMAATDGLYHLEVGGKIFTDAKIEFTVRDVLNDEKVECGESREESIKYGASLLRELGMSWCGGSEATSLTLKELKIEEAD